MRSSRSTAPSAAPARSTWSGGITPGCSAVSPPSSGTSARAHPAATEATTERSRSGSSRPPPCSRPAREGRPGRSEVVDAHGDQVVPTPSQRPVRRQFELGSHAVGCEHEYWVLVARRQLDAAGEPSNPPTTPLPQVAVTRSAIASTWRSAAARSTPAVRYDVIRRGLAPRRTCPLPGRSKWGIRR